MQHTPGAGQPCEVEPGRGIIWVCEGSILKQESLLFPTLYFLYRFPPGQGPAPCAVHPPQETLQAQHWGAPGGVAWIWTQQFETLQLQAILQVKFSSGSLYYVSTCSARLSS